MTPAKQTAYIDLATGAVSSSLGAIGDPEITLILLTGGTLEFAFVKDGVVVALTSPSDPVFVIKKEKDAAGAALFRDADGWDVTGTGEDTRYAFTGQIYSDDLDDALTGLLEKKLMAQVSWTLAADTYASSSLPFPVKVVQNFNRETDTSLIITDRVALEINAELDALEVTINGTSRGFLILSSDPHP